jgi:hypothetical protein
MDIKREEGCENPGSIGNRQATQSRDKQCDKKNAAHSEEGRGKAHGKIAGRNKAYPSADPIIQRRLLLMGGMASDLIKRMGVKGNLKQFVDPQTLEVQVVKPEGQRKKE